MEPHYVMLLAPFQPATRIELETNVNTSAECYLDIKNADDKTLNVRAYTFPDWKEIKDLLHDTNNFADKFFDAQIFL